jgi:HSP20 family protein
MTLIKSNRNLFPQIPMLFDDLFSRELFNWGNSNYSSTSTTVPLVNIRETRDNFEVEMAAPGMEKKDFSVTLEGNTLTIASKKENEETENQDAYTRKEFSYQSFVRSFILPKDVVKADEIVAKYDNGLLLLTVPKQEHAKQRDPKLIEIS